MTSSTSSQTTSSHRSLPAGSVASRTRARRWRPRARARQEPRLRRLARHGGGGDAVAPVIEHYDDRQAVTQPVLQVALLAAEHDAVAGRLGEEAGAALDRRAQR